MNEKNHFTQLCCWPGTFVGIGGIKKFESEMESEMGVRVKYAEEVVTFPDYNNGYGAKDTGGRNDLLFYIHSEDIPKFAVPRLGLGIRWWEDVIRNVDANIYPAEITNKYQRTW